jgi:hypothetical protein
MFSNLEISPDGRLNNHLLIPQNRASDVGTYLALRDLKIVWRLPPSLKHKGQEAFLRKANWVNLEALRWILREMCNQVESISAEVSQNLVNYRSTKNLCQNKDYTVPRVYIPIEVYPPNDDWELKILTVPGDGL